MATIVSNETEPAIDIYSHLHVHSPFSSFVNQKYNATTKLFIILIRFVRLGRTNELIISIITEGVVAANRFGLLA